MTVQGKRHLLFLKGWLEAPLFSCSKYPRGSGGLVPRRGRIFAKRKFEAGLDEWVFGVEHAFQIEPLRRADGPAGGAGAGGESLCHIFGRP
jgi:hypothetical protein